jgi:acyl carrier protein phosphodiesterase
MNFLAHLCLSGDDEKIMVGNFIGDFVKGKDLEQRYHPQIAKGIRLHREIDFFTDRHLIVKQSKDRLREKYRHFSGVIVDIYYDHFLAKNWSNYSDEVLPDYADKCYSVMLSHESILPEEVKYMLQYMIKGNWLVNYSKLEGIHRALSGMARRSKFDSKMEEASFDLQHDYIEYEKEFISFFPLLRNYCRDWLVTHSTKDA